MRISDWSSDVCSSDLNLSSRPVTDKDGQPVQSRDAVDRRNRLIEHLASLAPVPAALDQILHHFGTDMVAEVTGRSRRIVRKRGSDGIDRHVVETRPGSANLCETDAFQADAKRSEEHTSELQSLMRISYAVFCLKKKIKN